MKTGVKADPTHPLATYRVQLGKEFTFPRLDSLLSYFKSLGISDLYFSPITKARNCSTHCYDVVDPTRIHPALGGEVALENTLEALCKEGLSVILDVVPNHMARDPENSWWMSVLEHGQSSRYSRFFDIRWNDHDGEIEPKISLPVLGRPFGQALENGEIEVTFRDGQLLIRYFEHAFPLEPSSYSFALTLPSRSQTQTFATDTIATANAIAGKFASLPPVNAADDEMRALRRSRTRDLQLELSREFDQNNDFAKYMALVLSILNGKKGNPPSYNALESLLSMQNYLLSYWRTAPQTINYRRFFDVNELIALRMDDETVFELTHELNFYLTKHKAVRGLRIDHIDGLLDPQKYLARLRSKLPERARPYIYVEKILGAHEDVCQRWPIAGTTGYDFLNALNRCFVHRTGYERIQAHYQAWTGEEHLSRKIQRAKASAIEHAFLSEFHAIELEILNLAHHFRHGKDIPLADISDALRTVTSHLGVYRIYFVENGLESNSKEQLIEAARVARIGKTEELVRAVDFVETLFLLNWTGEKNALLGEKAVAVVRRWAQLSSAVMAKGYEDCVLYDTFGLVSLNEVGSHLGQDEFGAEQFHSFIKMRLQCLPLSMNATSTHDTKRSEDVRARLNVLSEIPDLVIQKFSEWHHFNESKFTHQNKAAVPDAALEWFVYQTMIGAAPLSQDEMPQFKERMIAYMLKAVRERKRHTSWHNANLAYEEALTASVSALLNDTDFMGSFKEFLQPVAAAGLLNSLNQVILKTLCPGVPDFYQGNEGYVLALVDPDNRRTPDFTTLERIAQKDVPTTPAGWSMLLKNPATFSDAKLNVTRLALSLRSRWRELFEGGDYVSLPSSNALCFGRTSGGHKAIVVCGLHFYEHCHANGLSGAPLEGCEFSLPSDLTGVYLNVSENRVMALTENNRLVELSSPLPFTVFVLNV